MAGGGLHRVANGKLTANHQLCRRRLPVNGYTVRACLESLGYEMIMPGRIENTRIIENAAQYPKYMNRQSIWETM